MVFGIFSSNVLCKPFCCLCAAVITQRDSNTWKANYWKKRAKYHLKTASRLVDLYPVQLIEKGKGEGVLMQPVNISYIFLTLLLLQFLQLFSFIYFELLLFFLMLHFFLLCLTLFSHQPGVVLYWLFLSGQSVHRWSQLIFCIYPFQMHLSMYCPTTQLLGWIGEVWGLDTGCKIPRIGSNPLYQLSYIPHYGTCLQ